MCYSSQLEIIIMKHLCLEENNMLIINIPNEGYNSIIYKQSLLNETA